MTDMSYHRAIQEYGNHVRLITEAWNSRNIDKLLLYFTEDIFWDDPAMEEPAYGHDAVKKFALSLWRAIPDFQYIPTGEPFISTDRTKIVQPWKISGTMLGPLDPPGFAPTGRTFEIDGFDLMEFRDGKLCHCITRFDGMHLAQQLGFLPRNPVSGTLKARIGVSVQRFVAWFVRRSSR